MRIRRAQNGIGRDEKIVKRGRIAALASGKNAEVTKQISIGDDSSIYVLLDKSLHNPICVAKRNWLIEPWIENV